MNALLNIKKIQCSDSQALVGMTERKMIEASLALLKYSLPHFLKALNAKA